MIVAIVGVGLIGGSLAIDIKRRGIATEVIGIDSNPKHCEQAIDLKMVDRIDTLESALQKADLVVLAIPVNTISALLPKILDVVPFSTTITDMGSTKGLICEVVSKHPKRSQFVPSHPMAGTENSGPSAALSELFNGKIAIICDPEKSELFHLERVKMIYSALGSRIISMSSIDHDFHVAYVSHLSHISSFALSNTVLDKEKDVDTIFYLAGSGFESTVRLAKSSPEMWTPIFDQNRTHVIAALDCYIQKLNNFREALALGQLDRLENFMHQANEIRKVLQPAKK